MKAAHNPPQSPVEWGGEVHFKIIPFDSSHLHGILSVLIQGKQINKDTLPLGEECVCVCFLVLKRLSGYTISDSSQAF